MGKVAILLLMNFTRNSTVIRIITSNQVVYFFYCTLLLKIPFFLTQVIHNGIVIKVYQSDIFSNISRSGSKSVPHVCITRFHMSNGGNIFYGLAIPTHCYLQLFVYMQRTYIKNVDLILSVVNAIYLCNAFCRNEQFCEFLTQALTTPYRKALYRGCHGYSERKP